MTFFDQTARPLARPATGGARTTRTRGPILVWLAAWQEYYRLQKLDAHALRDMGISEQDRARVTVSQIAARMRG